MFRKNTNKGVKSDLSTTMKEEITQELDETLNIADKLEDVLKVVTILTAKKEKKGKRKEMNNLEASQSAGDLNRKGSMVQRF